MPRLSTEPKQTRAARFTNRARYVPGLTRTQRGSRNTKEPTMTATAEITWTEALAAYEAADQALNIAAQLDPHDPHYVAALDTWCNAMDVLVERVPAPDMAAVAAKIRIAEVRTNGPEGSGAQMLDDHWAAVKADIARLAATA